MNRSFLMAGALACTLSACGGGGGGNNGGGTDNPPTGNSTFDDDAVFDGIALAGECDIRFVMGFEGLTAFIEIDKDIYKEDTCLDSDEEHVSALAMEAVRDEAFVPAFDVNDNDASDSDCSYTVKGTYQLASHRLTLLDDAVSGTCSQELLRHAAPFGGFGTFNGVFVIAIGDEVARQGGALDNPGRITLDLNTGNLTY